MSGPILHSTAVRWAGVSSKADAAVLIKPMDAPPVEPLWGGLHAKEPRGTLNHTQHIAWSFAGKNSWKVDGPRIRDE
jgi:hypothetical protein